MTELFLTRASTRRQVALIFGLTLVVCGFSLHLAICNYKARGIQIAGPLRLRPEAVEEGKSTRDTSAYTYGTFLADREKVKLDPAYKSQPVAFLLAVLLGIACPILLVGTGLTVVFMGQASPGSASPKPAVVLQGLAPSRSAAGSPLADPTSPLAAPSVATELGPGRVVIPDDDDEDDEDDE
ncbi:MAG: hypothetical protein HYS13_23120 [Planctomycetia bacterium]|nr:hypothetical protein [Planctomycetia bacterium]